MCKCIKGMFLLLLILCGAALYFWHGIILDKAGKMLLVKDDLKPVDAIVVLSGEPTERVEYAAKLFRAGWARRDRMIITGGPVAWKYTSAGLMKEHAMALGIPARSILTAEKTRSTEEDAMQTKEILAAHGYRSIILVTSPYHSRRAAAIFRKVLGPVVTVISAPVEESWFKFDNWWTRERERDMVLNECSKFVRLLIFGTR